MVARALLLSGAIPGSPFRGHGMALHALSSRNCASRGALGVPAFIAPCHAWAFLDSAASLAFRRECAVVRVRFVGSVRAARRPRLRIAGDLLATPRFPRFCGNRVRAPRLRLPGHTRCRASVRPARRARSTQSGNSCRARAIAGAARVPASREGRAAFPVTCKARFRCARLPMGLAAEPSTAAMRGDRASAANDGPREFLSSPYLPTQASRACIPDAY